MTIKEAVLSVIQIKDVSDAELEKALIDRELDGNSEYKKENADNVDLVAVDMLVTLLGLSSVKEGDMSVSWNTEGIKTRLLFLAKKHNLHEILDLIDPKPTIEAVRLW